MSQHLQVSWPWLPGHPHPVWEHHSSAFSCSPALLCEMRTPRVYTTSGQMSSPPIWPIWMFPVLHLIRGSAPSAPFPRVRCVTHPVTMPGPPDLAPESGYDGHACVTWFSSVTEWYWLALARTWGNTRLHLSRSRSQEGPKVPANDTSYQRHRDA